jgi:hypothetical protein
MLSICPLDIHGVQWISSPVGYLVDYPVGLDIQLVDPSVQVHWISSGYPSPVH